MITSVVAVHFKRPLFLLFRLSSIPFSGHTFWENIFTGNCWRKDSRTYDKG